MKSNSTSSAKISSTYQRKSTSVSIAGGARHARLTHTDMGI
jgi:hypothetical protein